MQENSREDEKVVNSKMFATQINPKIKVSNNYINYTEYQRAESKISQIKKYKSPLINENDEIIGEVEEIEAYYFNTGETKRERDETIDSKEGIFSVDTQIVYIGNTQLSVQSTITRRNELTGNREKSEYTKDEFGNEIYTYMENDRIEKKITKNARGTTIDIFKDGQPYVTYEYDENGKALIPMEKIEQLPEDYVESSFKEPIPKYYEIVESYNLEEETGKTIRNERESILDSISNRMDKAIQKMENFNTKLEDGLENFAAKSDKFMKKTLTFANSLFERSLINAGFNSVCIEWMKSKIKSVDAKILLAMDNILNKTQEKNMEKGEMDNGGR